MLPNSTLEPENTSSLAEVASEVMVTTRAEMNEEQEGEADEPSDEDEMDDSPP